MFTNERLFTIQAFTITRVHCISLYCCYYVSNSYKKNLVINLSYWLPDIKVAQFSFEMIFVKFFPKKCHFQIISDVQWWTKKFLPFLNFTYQEWMIFAKIGDGSCYYLWNEICAGVECFQLVLKKLSLLEFF